tara:strand:+ start:307 stop:699 length:393 start_codon:yes stop_codon:yes gene_type:complete
MSPDQMLEKIKNDITVDISWDDHTESLSIDVETENSVVSFEFWSSIFWRLQKLKHYHRNGNEVLTDLEKYTTVHEIIKLIQELRNVADDLEEKTNDVINQDSLGVITSVALGDPESIKLRPRRKYKKFSP